MNKVDAILVSHTHWDREWHRPFQEFRVRLVELIDLVLDILTTDPAFRQFHLDGQTVALEDYLEVRPEREELLRNLISDERLLVGPWYVLPDEFLVSGEALIRNFILGHRIAKSFGHAMSVGYLPDQFGQISQMPQILRGFGLDSVILWRGLEYERSVHNEFIWESPDGSRVLGIHLPPRGYGGLDKLADDPEGGRKKIAALLNFLAPRSASGHVLVMNGDDHAFPEPGLPAFLEGLSDEFDIRQGSLEEYIDLVRSSIDEESLSVVRGELISSKDTRVLQSVYSTRMYIKQLNHACETALERWAEPTTVYRWWLGTAPQRGLLGLSWKWLMKNHPHDSICGCSVDQVHKEMLTRFSWSKQIADMLIAENIASITEKIDTHDLLHDESEQAIIVFNPTNFPGDQVVEGKCDLRSSLAMDKLAVVGNGAVVPLEVLSWEKTDPEQDVVRARIRFLATDLPENGYASYRIMRAEGETALPRDIHAGDGWIENAHYRITLQHNGTIEILDKDCGNCYSGCLRFEDQGDRGDEYTFDPVPGSAPIYSKHATLIASESDHLQATLKIRTEMDLPRELAPSRDERSAQTERCEIETLISLSSLAKRIDFSVSYTNTVRDHRLRVLFPCGVDTDEVHVDENFDVVTRKIAVPRGEGWNEAPYPTKHVDRFLYLSDGKKVFALIPKGLPEYEVIDDKLRTVALTLIRGVGSLARRDLRNRRDSAGPVRATPEAQSLGSHTFEFAVYTSSGRYDGAELLRQASTFIAPPRIVSKMRARGDLPTRLSFFSVNPSVLEVTALKPAEESGMAVLRLFNPTEEEQCGVIWFYCPIKRAFLLNLNEEILSPISQSSEKELEITLRAKQIRTIGIELATWGGGE
jgi:mannosylglycerate hydrolase